MLNSRLTFANQHRFRRGRLSDQREFGKQGFGDHKWIEAVALPEFPFAADLVLRLFAVAVVVGAKRRRPFIIRALPDAAVILAALDAGHPDVRCLGLLAADAARLGADEIKKGRIEEARSPLANGHLLSARAKFFDCNATSLCYRSARLLPNLITN